MFYPAAEYLADEIEKASAPDDVKAMHLDLGHVSEIDSGTADALKFTLSHVESLGVHVTVENANVSIMILMRFYLDFFFSKMTLTHFSVFGFVSNIHGKGLNDLNLNMAFRRVSLDR